MNNTISTRYFKAIIYTSIHILFICTILFFQHCKSPNQKPDDPVFDSLVVAVNAKLKTNADTALQLSDELFSYAEKQSCPEQIYEAAHLRGSAFFISGRNDSALYYFKIAENIADQLNDTSKMILACSKIGTLMADMGSNDSVAYWYRKGFDLALLINDTLYQAVFTTNMGLYYMQSNQMDSAMQCYTKAALFYEELGESANLAQVYRNLSHILIRQNFQHKAIPIIHKSIQINKQLGKLIDVGIDYSILAIAYKETNKDSVYYYFQLSMNYLAESGSINNLMMIKFNYANYLKSINKIDEADKLYKEVLQISGENNILQGQIYSLNLLAKTAVIRKNLSSANSYFEKAILIAQNNKSITDELRLYKEAFYGNMELRNFDVATTYFELWENLYDSLQIAAQNNAVVKYNTLFETQKKDMSIKILENEKEKNRMKSKYVMVIFFISMLGAIAILYVMWLRSKNTKQKLVIAENAQKSQQLELNNKELLLVNKEKESTLVKNDLRAKQNLLVSKMLLISHNSEFLSDILLKLKSLNLVLENTEQQNQLKRILKSVKSQLNSKSWEEFQKQYHEAHEDFFSKLSELHSDLTAGERRLCAMLRMNLSIKEMSELTKQTPRAIEVARYRLRTKFGLEREANLTAYLAQFQ